MEIHSNIEKWKKIQDIKDGDVNIYDPTASSGTNFDKGVCHLHLFFFIFTVIVPLSQCTSPPFPYNVFGYRSAPIRLHN